MSQTKLAYSWADLLLVAVLSTLGAGICALAGHAARTAMIEDRPEAAAYQDSAGVERLERARAEAGDEHAALRAHYRETRLRLLRDSVMLGLLAETAPPTNPPSAAGAEAERARLRRSLRADSALGPRLAAAAEDVADTMAARHRALAAARKSADERYGEARAAFARRIAGWTVAGAALGVALLLAVSGLLLPRAADGEPGVHRALVLRTAAGVIALSLVYQLLGGPVTLLLGAAGALVLLLPLVKHAP